MRTCLFGIVIVALAMSGFGRAIAGDWCCSHCGCAASCRKVCRLVPDERKIETHCWGCKCEDFCVTGCSERSCEHCETICDPCENAGDPNAPCTKAKRFVWFDWCPPSSAKMYTKKKLMRKTITKKVPGYKWVVEDLCAQCEANCPPSAAPADGKGVPPAPAAEASAAGFAPLHPRTLTQTQEDTTSKK